MLRKVNYRTTIKCITFFTFLLFCATGCNDRKSEKTSYQQSDIVWADTITYEVLISNPDSLNQWESLKVKDVRQADLVNSLFEMVYTGKKKAYHYYNNEALDIDDIKALEDDINFNRDRVGKLQFKETWVYNEDSKRLEKRIHSILIAYELYNDYNELRGYKAAFYLKDF
ncbi:hypothetical protein [Labilibacter marinus]|uniref:hypothetical protein n=1 Tax=Labilibacter marinus TaxID=1477105 RepID=UPI00094FE64A|nr:hypothetical protein [Labilibacter marinus]